MTWLRCQSVASFLFGLFGGFTAWFATDFFVRPLAKFFALRAEVATALALYEEPVDPDVFSSSDWLAQRKLAYARCGATLVAFATSNSLLVRYLYRVPLRAFRYYVRNAGLDLLNLSKARPGTAASDHFRKRTIHALKLWYWPPSGAPSRAELRRC
jgi:hypothetical protein